LEAYYGKNVERLVKIKTVVDPSNRFTFPQAIPLDLSNGEGTGKIGDDGDEVKEKGETTDSYSSRDATAFISLLLFSLVVILLVH
jgi:hypothetical protein